VKLSDDQVKEIREKRKNGVAQLDLAEDYGVAQSTVSSLITGARRPEAGGPITGRDYFSRRRS